MQKSELKNKLETAVDHLRQELSNIRTGRATPVLIEDIEVSAYGSKMTVKEVASITVQDAQMLLVAPWDKSVVKSIDKAIRESDLHLNPAVDGDVVRVPIPALTEERRKEFAKLASVKAEECKQAIRNIRQDAMKSIDKQFNEKVISEDEKFTMKEDFESVVKDYTAKANTLVEDKQKDILTV